MMLSTRQACRFAVAAAVTAGLRHTGQVQLMASHLSMHAVWKEWPHGRRNGSSVSLRHTAQVRSDGPQKDGRCIQ